MLSTTIKVVFAIGFLTFAASQWLYSQTDRIALSRLADEVAGREDPLTTGSLAGAAQATRLDPCASPAR